MAATVLHQKSGQNLLPGEEQAEQNERWDTEAFRLIMQFFCLQSISLPSRVYFTSTLEAVFLKPTVAEQCNESIAYLACRNAGFFQVNFMMQNSALQKIMCNFNINISFLSENWVICVLNCSLKIQLVVMYLSYFLLYSYIIPSIWNSHLISISQ